MDTERTPFLARVSEDWWAAIIGLTLAALVWLGAITHVPWPLFGFLK